MYSNLHDPGLDLHPDLDALQWAVTGNPVAVVTTDRDGRPDLGAELANLRAADTYAKPGDRIWQRIAEDSGIWRLIRTVEPHEDKSR